MVCRNTRLRSRAKVRAVAIACALSAVLVAVFMGCGPSTALPSSPKSAEPVTQLAGRDDVVLAPDGSGYGVYSGERFELHDQQGALLGSMRAAPLGYRHKLVGQGRVLAPIVEQRGPEEGRLLGLELRDARAERVLARFMPPEGVRFSRPSADALTLALPGQVARYGLDGREQWRFALEARELAVADGADRVALIAAEDSRRVVLLANGRRIGTADLREPIWNVALSTNGEHAAVTTQHELHALRNGRLQLNLKLPLTAAVSLAVADDGRALVGGQVVERGEEHVGRVLCYAPDGRLLAEQTLARDDSAFRPAVRWLDAERYVARTSTGERSGRCPRGGAR